MTKRTYNFWTDADDQYVLLTMNVPVKEVARDLGRTPTSIAARRTILRKRNAEAAKGGTTLLTVTTTPKPVDVSVTTVAPQPAKTDQKKLTDAMLEDFQLFNPVTADVWADENPSLWTRIKAWFRRS